VIDSLLLIILVIAGLVAASVLSSILSFRIGAPLLLVFLVVGLAAGSGLGLHTVDARGATLIGSAALALVLFDSGFHTSFRTFRLAALPALSLSTLGVALTAAVVAVPAHWLLGLDWTRAALMGAILSSTDAAAVFFLLRVGGITVRERVRSLLEVESSCNDPMAISLTLALIAVVVSGGSIADAGGAMVLDMLGQFVIAGIGGVGGGRLIVYAVNRLGIERSLLPILVLALALVLFASVSLVQGSGFLAVYVAGLVAGNARLAAPDTLRRFQDGISWLAQIAMFLTLGLLARPEEFAAALPAALAIAFVLLLVARPLAVGVSLLPFRVNSNEIAFVSWVGLRGAVSILLAVLPLMAGMADGRVYFNVAFLVVMVSLSLQGWTIRAVARWLGQIVPKRIGPVERMELEIPGARHELVSYRVVAESLVAQGHRMPRWAEPSLVVRDQNSLLAHAAGTLQPGDLVWLFARPERVPHLDRLFASPAAQAESDHRFYGDFPIDPHAHMEDLAQMYGLEVPDEAHGVTVAQFLEWQLGSRPGIGDRVLVGGVELIVRTLDHEDVISEVGLAAEPTRVDAPRLPVVLGGRDIKALLNRVLGRWR
jgi:potassium/hydrogen antiporter